MFIYDKKLQYPIKIDKPNPRLASIIISQYGGPDGELGASLRYLSQRYSMPFDETNSTSCRRLQQPRSTFTVCRMRSPHVPPEAADQRHSFQSANGRGLPSFRLRW